MNISNLIITTEQISGNNEGTGLCLSVASGYEYVNGKVTDTITHTKYTCVFPSNQYEKLVVKVKNTKPIFSNEQIVQKGGNIKVSFKNLTGKFYRNNTGDYALSASADGLEMI